MKESEVKKAEKEKGKRSEKIEHLCNCVAPGQSLKDDDDKDVTATKSLGEKQWKQFSIRARTSFHILKIKKASLLLQKRCNKVENGALKCYFIAHLLAKTVQ
jgi:hypothetical protein